MGEPFVFCEECNTPLTQCGLQGVDGEPSLHCLVCELREQLAAARSGLLMWQNAAIEMNKQNDELRVEVETWKQREEQMSIRASLANDEVSAWAARCAELEKA